MLKDDTTLPYHTYNTDKVFNYIEDKEKTNTLVIKSLVLENSLYLRFLNAQQMNECKQK